MKDNRTVWQKFKASVAYWRWRLSKTFQPCECGHLLGPVEAIGYDPDLGKFIHLECGS
jgi:hypothetical protein